MSQGRSTQQQINISMVVTCVAAGIGILVLAANYRNLTLGLIILAIGAITSMFYLVLRCKSCGLGVTRDADGSRTQRSTWPRANPACKKCGADIP